MEFACEVWDPYLFKVETTLENIQRRAVRFIANLRGVESVTVAKDELGLALLGDRQKSARIVILLKTLSSNVHRSLMDQFDAVVSNTHSHNTRSVAHNDPELLQQVMHSITIVSFCEMPGDF